MHDELLHRVERLESRQRLYQGALALSLLALGVAVFSRAVVAPASAAGTTAAGQVLHVRGIVVEDASRRPRIVIGAPTPSVPGRPEQRESVAIAVLGESGADRVVLGYSPNPVVNGKVYARTAAAVGLTLHAASGDERGGMAFLDGNDGGRAVVALDRPKGDGVGLLVDDASGFAGMMLNYSPQRPGELVSAATFGTKSGRVSLELSDPTGKPRTAYRLSGKGAPELVTLESDGTPVRDLMATARH